MLRKAREKAKEGFHSVQSETKRYLQSRQQRQHGPQAGPRGGHGPRSSRHQPTSAGPSFMSFKGVTDDFEAILNDESDFTNQFDEPHEAPGTGPSSIEEKREPPANGGSHGTDEDFHTDGDSDLFSDPLFSEPKHDVSLPEESHTNSADLLFAVGLTASNNHQENEFTATIKETDNTAIPNSDDTHTCSMSENSVLPSDVLNDSIDEAPLPELVAKAQDPLRPDSPLFSDDVMVGSTSHTEDDRKEDGQLNARILVTQPSDESPRQSRKLGADENRDDQLGEGSNQQPEEDIIDIHDLPKPSTPDLPDIEELEENLAVSKIGSGQDLFSSEESPFSSLASSYEGDKILGTMATATLPHTENTKFGHDESELFEEVVSAVVKEVNGRPPTTTTGGLAMPPQPPDSQQQPAMYSLDEELEMLLTPKQKPKVSSAAPSNECGLAPSSSSEPGLQSANAVVDDPLQAGSHPLVPGRESVSSHLDSGVFEQSGNSSTLKSTPERESVDGPQEDDLFPINEDHFKDDDDSTPVPVRRQLIKGTSNIEISQQSKKVLQSTTSAPAIMPPDVSKVSSNGSAPKKNSTGKVAPPRPAISPKLKHRMIQKQSASSTSFGGQHEEYTARKKLVQPLGQALQGRDAVRDHSPVRLETGVDSSSISDAIAVPPPAGRRGSSASPSKPDEKRIPADDLFLEDNIVSPNEVEKLPGLPQSTEEQSKAVELAETKSEDEEIRNYFLYHFLFAGLLYFYYSLNIFPYLSGFFAGFFVLYLTVGSVFIFYVQTVEKYQSGEGKEDRLLEPSQEFTELMHVDFDNLRVYKVSHTV